MKITVPYTRSNVKVLRLSRIHLIANLICIIILLTCSPLKLNALKIDNTHYRFCVMDDATFVDYAAVSAANTNQLPTFINSYWYSSHGVMLQGDKTSLKCQNHVTSLEALMTAPYYSEYLSSIQHSWGKGINGVVHDQYTYFYIEVDAPSGINILDIPTKMIKGNKYRCSTQLTGDYTPFSGNGYFYYIYHSSNPEVVSFDGGEAKANKPGKSILKVDAYAGNKKYDGSYFIGSAEIEIEVVEELGVISLDSWNCPTGFVSGQPFTGTLTVSSTYSKPMEYSLDAFLCVVEDNQYSIVENLGTTTVTIPANSSVGMDFSGTLGEIEPGNYHLVFAQDYKPVGALTVEVLPAPIVDEGEISLERWNSPTGFFTGKPYTGYVTVSSTYSKPVDYSLHGYICVFEDNEYRWVEDLGISTVTVPANSNAKLEFSGVLGDIEPGSYYLVFWNDGIRGTLEIDVIDGSISCERLSIMQEKLVAGEVSVIEAEISNGRDSEATGYATLNLYAENDNGVFLVASYGTEKVTLDPISKTSVTFSTQLPKDIVDGTYYLMLLWDNAGIYLEEVPISKSNLTSIDTIDHDDDVRYFNLQGLEVSNKNLERGYYIRKTGSKTDKILVK